MSGKALIVDNDFFLVEFLTETLETWGYQTAKAYGGAEALAKLEQENFDILFVDLAMPGISGKQIIQFFRSKFPHLRVPIVALAIPEQMDVLYGSGADYLFAKESVGKMTEHMSRLLRDLENRNGTPAESSFKSKDLLPRLSTDELVEMLNFHEAVTDQMGVGILILDREFKITRFNALAMRLLEEPYHAILNQRITSFFPAESGRIVGLLKSLSSEPDRQGEIHSVRVDSRRVHIILSPLKVHARSAGWIVVLCPHEYV